MVCFAVLFGIISFTSASAAITVIDDFESYWGTPAMAPPMGPWVDTSDPLSTATPTLGGVAMGGAYGAFQLNYNGGWVNPGDPLDLTTSGHASAGRALDGSIDFETGGELRMSLLINEADWATANFMIIELTGLAGDGVTDTWSQTLIPAKLPTEPTTLEWWGIPATIGFDWGGSIPRIPDGVWTEIAIGDMHHVFWGDPLTDHDSLTGISIQFWGGGEDLTGIAKMDGTDVVYPKMSVTANVGVDNIYYVPEPLTISLLGIGGLALIRRKR